MKLTGKAKEDFIKWCKQDAAWMDTYDDIFLFALIIEWLDSVGTHIETGIYPDDLGNIEFSGSFFGFLGGWDDDTTYKTRQEATQAAIEKANDLYNETNKTTSSIC